MKLKSVNLSTPLYHDYVSGTAVVFSPGKEKVSVGEHVMVFKNTVAASTSVSVPKSTQQSDSIGVEGVVTQIHNEPGEVQHIVIQKI
ncbi:MAG TPA: hypothetical protein VD884_01785 [Ohtaekwangia sp.]|nr:hypothetical protein [Ohtaekwangia sp.]